MLLAVPSTPGHRFAHEIVREVLYDELPAPRAMTLHRRVAEALRVDLRGRTRSARRRARPPLRRRCTCQYRRRGHPVRHQGSRARPRPARVRRVRAPVHDRPACPRGSTNADRKPVASYYWLWVTRRRGPPLCASELCQGGRHRAPSRLGRQARLPRLGTGGRFVWSQITSPLTPVHTA